MKATEKLHEMGQSLWLDNITRDLLTSGTLRRYSEEWSVTGLTSNPTIFDHAIKNSTAYDQAMRQKLKEGKLGEQVFFGRPIHRKHHTRRHPECAADHGEIGRTLPAHGGDCEEVLARFAKAGIDIRALAARLQDEGAKSFVKSWQELLAVIASKSEALKKAG
jgi:transaldolase